MTVTKAILSVLLTSFSVHYGWRMRGTVVGGEKGAMLPGLLAGLMLALFSGGDIARFFWIPAAAGLIGMSYGGIEPYGDTISFLEDKHAVEPDPVRGYCGLALKGALWFSIGGGFIGMAVSAMGSKYSVTDILIFIPMIFALQFIGYRIFNQPYDLEKKIFPKIYLSFESRDEWGSNVGVLTAILIMTILRKDYVALRMTGLGFLFGAIGWVVAMKLYHYTEHPMKSGKYLYGVFYSKGLVGGWSNMEYTLGTFGGAGIALGYVLSGNQISEINRKIASEGIFSPLSGFETESVVIITSLFAILLLINIFEYVRDKNGKKYNSFIMDCIERPFFNTLPFALILLCSLPCAKLMTAFMIIYVLCIKNWFDRLKPGKTRTVFIAVSGIICIAAYVLTLVTSGPGPLIILLACGIPYILAESVWAVKNRKDRDGKNIFASINGTSFNISLLTIQSIIVAVLGYIVSAV